MRNKVKRKVILLGHIDGLGGSQTAFKELLLFCKQEGHEIKIIPITDLPTSSLEYDENILLGKIEHQAGTVTSKVRKCKSLLWVAFQARLFAPDLFVSVGLGNSANFIGSFLSKKCFKIGQDFIATREANDAVWKKARLSFDGIAVQAPSMLYFWQQTEAGIKGINWLPCFPQPLVKDIYHIKDYSKETEEIKVGYFGRLAANKGLHLLLNALADKTIVSRVKIDLWGKGDEEKRLKRLATDLNLNDSVRFLGPFPSDEAGAKLMVTYDALALTSTGMEGLPLILLEAMAYGIPFLTTNVGAIKDCCLNNLDCILAEPTQDSINQALSELINRIDSESFDSSRLRRYYVDNFSYEILAGRWRNCFNNPQKFFYG